MPPAIYNFETGIISVPDLPATLYSHAEYSPDGRQIALLAYYELYVLDIESGDYRHIPLEHEPIQAEFMPGFTAQPPYYEITWGSDHTAIVSIGAVGYSGLYYQRQYLIDLETGDRDEYEITGNTHLPLEYSPDGESLAILSSVDERLIAEIVTVETGEVQEVISDTFNIPWDVEEIPFEDRRISQPVWSPDSSAFAFVADGEVYIINRSDSSIRQLTIGTIDAVAEWLTPDLLVVGDYIDGFYFRMLDFDIMTIDGQRFRSGNNWAWETAYQNIRWLPEIIIPATPVLPTGTPLPVYCDNSLASRLYIGARAFVVISPEGESRSDLRVRAEPGGEQIASMSEGTQFTIVDGPVCVDGLTWWQIETLDGEISGWSAESIAPDTYLIQPES